MGELVLGLVVYVMLQHAIHMYGVITARKNGSRGWVAVLFGALAWGLSSLGGIWIYAGLILFGVSVFLWLDTLNAHQKFMESTPNSLSDIHHSIIDPAPSAVSIGDANPHFNSIADIEFDYTDRHGDRSHRRVEVHAIDDEYFDGLCHKAMGTRTFVIGRIRGQVVDLETGEVLPPRKWAAVARQHPANTGIVDSRGRREPAPGQYDDESDEILFTGFTAARRAELEAMAETAGMIVRKGVTNNLLYLCAGPKAGPAKIDRAVAAGALIIDEETFIGLAR